MRTPCHVPTPPARRARDRTAEGRPGPWKPWRKREEVIRNLENLLSG